MKEKTTRRKESREEMGKRKGRIETRWTGVCDGEGEEWEYFKIKKKNILSLLRRQLGNNLFIWGLL